jgi:hypothetical protein
MAFAVLIYALMFRYGYFSGKAKEPNKIVSLDKFFPYIVDRKLSDKADVVCFWVSLAMAVLIALNGLLSFAAPKIPNIRMLFLMGAFPGAMILRFIYMGFKRKNS